MAKKEDEKITLIIAKSFANLRLTPSETEISRKFTHLELVGKHELTQQQAEKVLKWCAISCAGNSHYSKQEE